MTTMLEFNNFSDCLLTMFESVLPRRISKTNDLWEKTKRANFERKRCILHLILSYLKENNYNQTVQVFQHEAQIGGEHEVCENVDLDIILQEYQSYYYTKLQKYPKILRKIETSGSVVDVKNANKQKTKSAEVRDKNLPKTNNKNNSNAAEDFRFEIVSLSQDIAINDSSKSPITNNSTIESLELLYDSYGEEYRDFMNVILKQSIIQIQPNQGSSSVTFNNCIGLENAVEKLKEALFYPLQYPELFSAIKDESWNGILLFGPPGNGKTLLAKAAAVEMKCTFINVTSSTFVSKWRGESEKMLKVLFDVAKFYSPTIIFIDEVDSMICSNSEGRHEASRRFKGELLALIDGITGTLTEDSVLVLATTNKPWALDKAVLRRFEKRILVDVASESCRAKLFQHYIKLYGSNYLCVDDVKKLAECTSNFSAQEIKLVCKEARMEIIREQIKRNSANLDKMSLRDISLKDLECAVQKIRPCTTPAECSKFREWALNYGSI